MLRRPYVVGGITAVGGALLDGIVNYSLPTVWEWFKALARFILM
jgi:hypothetical protein